MSGLGWLAGVVAVSLMVAGCSGGEPSAAPPAPSTSPPTTSPVTTASPTPTPSAPTLPAAAQKNTKAAAVAFAHHYIDLVNHASSTGHVKALRATSAKTCKSCRNFVTIIEDVYGQDGSINGGEWNVESYSAIAAGPPSTWLVAMNLDAEPQMVRTSADAAAERRNGGDFSASVYVRWANDSWLVNRLVRDE